ncbi:4'-phosphopantetheinyl transferase superfamily protein [Psychrobacter sp.]|uniref:4'-phosphopantetheinyl transferase family protein n=1 Tax=Psychrobacter sp. TaxID=56811 RepID=UPI002600F36C|nr:4'-phosphopantetheinyl transferase superfamily protein [Psychrobacter sp.]
MMYKPIINALCLKALSLNQTYYFGFSDKGESLPLHDYNSSAWIAVSSYNYANDNNTTQANRFNYPNSKTKSFKLRTQKLAVRQLCYHLISELIKGLKFKPINALKIEVLKTHSIKLLEDSYPFRLLPFNYYVCFSHSDDMIACAIHKNLPIGIDLETNQISSLIAKRFYTKDENQWILGLSSKEQPVALKILWMLKEASIKLYNYKEANLISGLNKNLLIQAQHLMPEDIINIKKDLSIFHSNDKKSNIKSIQLENATYLYIASKNLVAIW